MNKTKFKSMFLALLSLVLFFTFSISSSFTAKALGNIYYVDSANGNDNNDGTTANSAWKSFGKVNSITFKPGDKILLKADSIFSEMLSPKGSGEKDSPITIDMYGTGSKPIINGNGIPMPNAPVKLSNQSYFEINNLEITNDAASAGNRAGIFVHSDNKTINNYIHLNNLYIHNVKGSLDSSSGKLTGGIIIDAAGALGTRYDDILIQGCTIKSCDRSGINVGYIDESANGNSDYYNTNIVLKNNSIDDAGGDGILIYHSAAPLVEHNMLINGNSRVYNYESSEKNADSKQADAGYANAIYSWSCNDAVFQYNEVYGENSSNDTQNGGSAFNIAGYDTRNVIQYNYTHDNKGGFVAIGGQTGDASNGSIIRYNISQNDNHNIFYFYGGSKDTYIYNNTIYNKTDMNISLYNFEKADNSLIASALTWHENCYSYNNIFYNLGTVDFTLGSSIKTVFDYNVFYGNHSTNEPNDAHKLTTDPMLAGAGQGTKGLDSTYGYKLNSASSCINSGINMNTILTNNSVTKDYFGNPLKDSSDRGANEYAVDLSKLPAVPKNLTATPASSTQINLNWDPISGATGYDLSVDGNIINNVTSPYYNRDLDEDSAHTYKVRAVTADGTSPWSDAVLGNTEPPLPNLVLNSGFEDGYKNWTDIYGGIFLDNVNTHKGNYAMRIGNSTGGIGQIIKQNVYEKKSYTFSAWGKSSSVYSTCIIGVDCLDASGRIIRRGISQLEFNKLSYEQKTDSFTTPAGTAQLRVYICNNTGYVYADDIRITAN